MKFTEINLKILYPLENTFINKIQLKGNIIEDSNLW